MFLIKALKLHNLNKYNKYVLNKYYSQKSVDLSNPVLQKYLKDVLIEYESLQLKPNRSIVDTRRYLKLKPLIEVLEQRITLYDSIESLKDLIKKDEDDEIKKMVKEEAQIYLKRMKEIDADLQNILIQPVFSEGGILLEVAAGAGGQEAMLFANELFEMYQRYATYKGWQFDIDSLDRSEIGGIRKASMLISGFGVPELMKLEAGVHRVQRVPATEKGGRIHTSTVSVAVLPQPSDIELVIPDRDIVIETKRASGAGGQHVNTTDSAVRITHTPTGTIVECQEGRSQIKNKQIAMQKLRAILLQHQQEEQATKIRMERKTQVGSGNRNEKIRTYNYTQDRVTEHREGGGTMHSLKTFMAGGDQLETLQCGLLSHIRYQEFINEINEYAKKSKENDSRQCSQ